MNGEIRLPPVRPLDAQQLKFEAVKMLQDWGKWLVTVETAVCAALWPKLTSAPPAHALLYFAWMLFAASILTATFLLLAAPFLLARFETESDGVLSKIRALVVVEYAFFLAGVLCFALRLIGVWLSA